MKYIIENGFMRSVRERVSKEIPLDEFMKSMQKNIPVKSGLLPPSCIYFDKRESCTVYVLEQTPRIQPIKYRVNADKIYRFEIGLPFIQYYISVNRDDCINDVYLSCTQLPINDIDDQTYCLPLPNQYDGGRGSCCIGNSLSIETELPINHKLKMLLNNFYEGFFNRDLSLAPVTCFRKLSIIDTLRSWDKKTKENPLFALTNALFEIENRTFKTKIEHLLGKYNYEF